METKSNLSLEEVTQYFWQYNINIYIYIILVVARYTDVTVWFVPRFGGHGSIRFRYNVGKKEIYYARFIFIYLEQTVVQKKILDVKILNIITSLYYIFIKLFLFSLWVYTNKSRPLYRGY